jgi:homoserine kinase
MPQTPSACIRVPGSTSNLGPGFDTLGIALRVFNHVRVTPTSAADPHIVSPIPDAARPSATSLIAEAAGLFFKKARKKPFGFDIHLSGDVPMARGLGSSVTVRLGTIAALNSLTGTPLERTDLFRLVASLEGHPDNAAPATFGGFTASVVIRGEPRCLRLAIPARFRFVTLIPDFEIPTPEARRLVPSSFSKADTVHNITHAAFITAAFARGDAPALRGAFEDRVHQPYRQALIPALDKVIAAGERAGAVGGWLSGSGSTIICLTPSPDTAPAVAKAMKRALPNAEVRILAADPGGFRVEKRTTPPTPPPSEAGNAKAPGRKAGR